VKIEVNISSYDLREKGLKQYVLKEYGSWGVMTLSYLTGVIVSSRVTPGSVTVFIAIALYINSKQAFVLWMRRRGESAQALYISAQVAAAIILLSVWEEPFLIDAVCSGAFGISALSEIFG
jgi:hypothetical protein